MANKLLVVIFIMGLAGAAHAGDQQDPKGLLWTGELTGQAQEGASQTCKDMGARLPFRIDYEIAQRHGLWSAIGMEGLEWIATSVNAQYQVGAYSTSATLEAMYDKYSNRLDFLEVPLDAKPGVRCVFDRLGVNATKSIDPEGSYKEICGVVHWVSEIYKNKCGTGYRKLTDSKTNEVYVLTTDGFSGLSNDDDNSTDDASGCFMGVVKKEKVQLNPCDPDDQTKDLRTIILLSQKTEIH